MRSFRIRELEMLYAILSDIHGNPSALEAALEDARAQGAEKIVCLGDVVGYGPDAVRAVELARASCDEVLMGNHDAATAGVLLKYVRWPLHITSLAFQSLCRKGLRPCSSPEGMEISLNRCVPL